MICLDALRQDGSSGPVERNWGASGSLTDLSKFLLFMESFHPVYGAQTVRIYG